MQKSQFRLSAAILVSMCGSAGAQLVPVSAVARYEVPSASLPGPLTNVTDVDTTADSGAWTSGSGSGGDGRCLHAAQLTKLDALMRPRYCTFVAPDVNSGAAYASSVKTLPDQGALMYMGFVQNLDEPRVAIARFDSSGVLTHGWAWPGLNNATGGPVYKREVNCRVRHVEGEIYGAVSSRAIIDDTELGTTHAVGLVTFLDLVSGSAIVHQLDLGEGFHFQPIDICAVPNASVPTVCIVGGAKEVNTGEYFVCAAEVEITGTVVRCSLIALNVDATPLTGASIELVQTEEAHDAIVAAYSVSQAPVGASRPPSVLLRMGRAAGGFAILASRKLENYEIVDGSFSIDQASGDVVAAGWADPDALFSQVGATEFRIAGGTLGATAGRYENLSHAMCIAVGTDGRVLLSGRQGSWFANPGNNSWGARRDPTGGSCSAEFVTVSGSAVDVGLDAVPVAVTSEYAEAWTPRTARLALDNAVACPETPQCWICFADFDMNGGVDGDDVLAFFAAWDANSDCADVNRTDGVDGDDVLAFFTAWDASGCCPVLQ